MQRTDEESNSLNKHFPRLIKPPNKYNSQNRVPYRAITGPTIERETHCKATTVGDDTKMSKMNRKVRVTALTTTLIIEIALRSSIRTTPFSLIGQVTWAYGCIGNTLFCIWMGALSMFWKLFQCIQWRWMASDPLSSLFLLSFGRFTSTLTVVHEHDDTYICTVHMITMQNDRMVYFPRHPWFTGKNKYAGGPSRALLDGLD